MSECIVIMGVGMKVGTSWAYVCVCELTCVKARKFTTSVSVCVLEFGDVCGSQQVLTRSVRLCYLAGNSEWPRWGGGWKSVG